MAAYTGSCQLGDILSGSAFWLMRRNAIARARQQLIGKKTRKNGFLARGRRLQRGGGFRLRLLGDHQQDGGGLLDGALKTKPVGGGQASQMLGIDAAEIQRDDAEAAGVQQEVGGANGMVQVMAGADPKQGAQVHAGLRGRMRVEGFAGVDDGTEFAAARGGGEQLMKKTGTPGRRRPSDFGKPAARAASDQLIERRDAGWQRVELMSNAPPTEERSEVVRESGHIRFLFAFVKLVWLNARHPVNANF